MAACDEMVRKSAAQTERCQIMVCSPDQAHTRARAKAAEVLSLPGERVACLNMLVRILKGLVFGETSLPPHWWREKNIHLVSLMLQLMLDRNGKLYLLILLLSAISVAFAPLHVCRKPSQEVLAS